MALEAIQPRPGTARSNPPASICIWPTTGSPASTGARSRRSTRKRCRHRDAAPRSLAADDATVVEDYLAAMRAAGRKTGRSTTQAAHSCQAKIRRAGGWGGLTAPAARRGRQGAVVHLLADGHRPHHRRCRTAQPHRSAAGHPGTPVLRHRLPVVHRNMFRIGISSRDTAAQWNIPRRSPRSPVGHRARSPTNISTPPASR